MEPSDAELFHAWNLDSERARNLDFIWPPVSLAQVREWVEGQTLKKLEGDAFHWVIENISGVPVGSLSTHHCDHRNGTFSYGVDIAAEHRRSGYAAEAIGMVLTYYFQELRYQKAAVQVHSYNTASIALHERLGFVREGELRRMVYVGGAYHNVYLYGITREEWEESLGE